MRITGGRYTNRRILCPPGVIRPAMDRMRESMFSILGPIDHSSFLDLFSGSGAVAIEAASRGAEPVHLVEMDRKKVPTIKKNLSFVDIPVRLFTTSAQQFMKKASGTYDIIYADPPFNLPNKPGLLELASQFGTSSPEGLFIIHHPSEEKWEDHIGAYRCFDVRTYGRSVLRFFRNEGSPS